VIRSACELNNPLIAEKGVNQVSKSLFTVNQTNIIIETVEFAEDNDGYIVRLFEAECSAINFTMTIGCNLKSVWKVNMLEDKEGEMTVENNAVTFSINPFEIVTLKIVR